MTILESINNLDTPKWFFAIWYFGWSTATTALYIFFSRSISLCPFPLRLLKQKRSNKCLAFSKHWALFSKMHVNWIESNAWWFQIKVTHLSFYRRIRETFVVYPLYQHVYIYSYCFCCTLYNCALHICWETLNIRTDRTGRKKETMAFCLVIITYVGCLHFTFEWKSLWITTVMIIVPVECETVNRTKTLSHLLAYAVSYSSDIVVDKDFIINASFGLYLVDVFLILFSQTFNIWYWRREKGGWVSMSLNWLNCVPILFLFRFSSSFNLKNLKIY